MGMIARRLYALVANSLFAFALQGCSQQESIIAEVVTNSVAPEATKSIATQIPAESAASTDRIRSWKDRITALHQPMGELQTGDWLESHREAGQSFEQYLLKERKPRVDGYTRMIIVPIGDVSHAHAQIMERTAEYLSANFGLPVDILFGIEVEDFPDDARRDDSRGYGEQLLTKHILDKVLPPLRPADALAVLAMTTHDLWPGDGWNFVFGQASLSQRVGVWSLARYGDPSHDEETYRWALERTVKVALHETGHMVGIPHCTTYECGMNGSNHLEETDRRPMEFCPECQAKIWWTCRYDPILRLQRLAALARTDRLHSVAGFWEAEAEMLQDDTPSP